MNEIVGRYNFRGNQSHSQVGTSLLEVRKPNETHFRSLDTTFTLAKAASRREHAWMNNVHADRLAECCYHPNRALRTKAQNYLLKFHRMDPEGTAATLGRVIGRLDPQSMPRDGTRLDLATLNRNLQKEQVEFSVTRLMTKELLNLLQGASVSRQQEVRKEIEIQKPTIGNNPLLMSETEGVPEPLEFEIWTDGTQQTVEKEVPETPHQEKEEIEGDHPETQPPVKNDVKRSLSLEALQNYGKVFDDKAKAGNFLPSRYLGAIPLIGVGDGDENDPMIFEFLSALGAIRGNSAMNVMDIYCEDQKKYYTLLLSTKGVTIIDPFSDKTSQDPKLAGDVLDPSLQRICNAMKIAVENLSQHCFSELEVVTMQLHKPELKDRTGFLVTFPFKRNRLDLSSPVISERAPESEGRQTPIQKNSGLYGLMLHEYITGVRDKVGRIQFDFRSHASFYNYLEMELENTAAKVLNHRLEKTRHRVLDTAFPRKKPSLFKKIQNGLVSGVETVKKGWQSLRSWGATLRKEKIAPEARV